MPKEQTIGTSVLVDQGLIGSFRAALKPDAVYAQQSAPT